MVTNVNTDTICTLIDRVARDVMRCLLRRLIAGQYYSAARQSRLVSNRECRGREIAIIYATANVHFHVPAIWILAKFRVIGILLAIDSEDFRRFDSSAS